MGKMKLEIEWNGMQKYKNKERKESVMSGGV